VTSGMLGNDQKVFPLSQYYVQNIQVPLTLAAGAKEKVCTAVTISYVGVQNPNPTFIGSGGLFVLSSGTLTKDYDENTDQTIFTVDGDISFSNLQISLKLGVLGTKTINSKDYVMPIRSGMIVNVSSGSTVSMNQDVALVPGAELNIAENATVTFGNGNSLYVYDADNWGRFCYYSSQDRTYYPVIYVPTGRADRSAGLSTDAKMLINGTVDASAGGFYTTAGGANIYSTGSGKVVMGTNSATATYQYSQVADSDDGHGEKAYISIPITTAKLRNDVNRYGESYTVTAGSTGSTTYTYDLISGTWGTKEVTVVPVYNGVADTNNAETGYALDSSAELAGYYSDATLKTPATEISGGSTVYRLAAATIIDGGSIEGYTKLSSAVKDYQNSGYIQMQQIGSEPGYIVDKDIILDLNKCDVYVGGATATIKGIDSGTNGYECADENLGSLSGVAADKIASTATVNGKHYLAITESDKTTFHRVAVSLTRYALKNPHLIVEGTFRGTTAAYDKLSDMGFNFDKNIVAPDPNNAEKTVETNNVWFGKKPAETTTGSGSTTVQFSFSAAAGTDYEVTPQMKLLTIALDKNNNPVYDILSGTKRTISIQAVLDAIAPPTTEEGV